MQRTHPRGGTRSSTASTLWWGSATHGGSSRIGTCEPPGSCGRGAPRRCLARLRRRGGGPLQLQPGTELLLSLRPAPQGRRRGSSIRALGPRLRLRSPRWESFVSSFIMFYVPFVFCFFLWPSLGLLWPSLVPCSVASGTLAHPLSPKPPKP